MCIRVVRALRVGAIDRFVGRLATTGRKDWAHYRNVGLDRIEFGGQAVESARVSRPEERIWDRHDVGSPMNTNSTQ